MSYALTTLWHERQRYLTAILAVSFCALLGCVQFGLLLGLFAITSMPVDNSRANIWLGAPRVMGVDLGRPIRESQALARLARHPDIERVEVFLQGFSYWARKDGGQELCMVVGSRLEPDAMGRNTALDKRPELVERLTEPGTVVIESQGGWICHGCQGFGCTIHLLFGDHRPSIAPLLPQPDYLRSRQGAQGGGA